MNREKKWTPGPWYTYTLDCGEIQTIGTVKNKYEEECICDDAADCNNEPPDLSVAGIWSTDDRSKANAALISAAPELVEALERLIEIEDNDELCDTHEHYNESYQSGELRDLIVKARSALAKAYGEVTP